MTGITIDTTAYIQSNGTLQVTGTLQDVNGNTDTLVLSVTQGLLTTGVGTKSEPTSGSPQGWSDNLAATLGSWTFGSAVAVAILLNVNGAQIGYATQELAVSIP